MRKFLVAALAAGALAISWPALSIAQVGSWTLLGQHTVKIIKPDHDVVPVGNTQGFFTHIDIKVARNSVHFYDVKVIYGNNEEDHLQVRKLIPAGGCLPSLLAVISGARVLHVASAVNAIPRRGCARPP